MNYLDLFEDLNRARHRASLCELEEVLSQMAELSAPIGADNRDFQRMLHACFAQTLGDCERRLTALRARHTAVKQGEVPRG